MFVVLSTFGKKGFSKDHRPDLNQMVVGAVLDDEGRPICCEMWPGNTTDVGTLVPLVDRLRNRFGIKRVCLPYKRSNKLENEIYGSAKTRMWFCIALYFQYV